MNRLDIKMGWEIVEEKWLDFEGIIFRNSPKNLVERLEDTVNKYPNLVGFICADKKLLSRNLIKR
jgi:hypothetical protein